MFFMLWWKYLHFLCGIVCILGNIISSTPHLHNYRQWKTVNWNAKFTSTLKCTIYDLCYSCWALKYSFNLLFAFYSESRFVCADAPARSHACTHALFPKSFLVLLQLERRKEKLISSHFVAFLCVFLQPHIRSNHQKTSNTPWMFYQVAVKNKKKVSLILSDENTLYCRAE